MVSMGFEVRHHFKVNDAVIINTDISPTCYHYELKISTSSFESNIDLPLLKIVYFREKCYVALKIVKSASHYTETALDEKKLLEKV